MSTHSQPQLPVGTVVDRGLIELVDVLGSGGYGTVYRAFDHSTKPHRQCAVKCLTHSGGSLKRQLVAREVAFHRVASASPHVAPVRRTFREDGFTFLIMDYHPAKDLFHMISVKKTYMGKDALIKRVFLQIIDALIFCHSHGIYHRDLKPENILCVGEDGADIQLTDFGLATTDEYTNEFGYGSSTYMSPECYDPSFSVLPYYSAPANDIWSLGILLLNLVTERNPWTKAARSDPAFQAYLNSPQYFFMKMFPITAHVNDILLQIFELEWDSRISLRSLRRAVAGIDHFIRREDEHFIEECVWKYPTSDCTSEDSISPVVSQDHCEQEWQVRMEDDLRGDSPLLHEAVFEVNSSFYADVADRLDDGAHFAAPWQHSAMASSRVLPLDESPSTGKPVLRRSIASFAPLEPPNPPFAGRLTPPSPLRVALDEERGRVGLGFGWIDMGTGAVEQRRYVELDETDSDLSGSRSHLYLSGGSGACSASASESEPEPEPETPRTPERRASHPPEPCIAVPCASHEEQAPLAAEPPKPKTKKRHAARAGALYLTSLIASQFQAARRRKSKV